jgi:hypothetical protein
MYSGEGGFRFDRGITIAALWRTIHGLSHARQRFADEVIQASRLQQRRGVFETRRHVAPSHRQRADMMPDGTPYSSSVETMFGWCWASDVWNAFSEPFAVAVAEIV